MRNARRPTAKSDDTRVPKHQSGVYGHGGRSYLAYIGGPEAYSPIRGPNFANAQCEALLRRISLDSVLQATMRGSGCPVMVPNAGTLGPATRIRRFEVPILRILNTRPSAAASRSAHVSKHEVGVELSCVGTSVWGNWPGDSHSPIRGPNFANAQDEAVQRRVPLGSVLQAPSRGRTFLC